MASPFWATFPLSLIRFTHAKVTSWKAFGFYTVNSYVWAVSQINLWTCSGSIFSFGFHLAYVLCNFSLYFKTEVDLLGIYWRKDKGVGIGVWYSVAFCSVCFSTMLSSINLGLKAKKYFKNTIIRQTFKLKLNKLFIS